MKSALLLLWSSLATLACTSRKSTRQDVPIEPSYEFRFIRNEVYYEIIQLGKTMSVKMFSEPLNMVYLYRDSSINLKPLFDYTDAVDDETERKRVVNYWEDKIIEMIRIRHEEKRYEGYEILKQTSRSAQ